MIQPAREAAFPSWSATDRGERVLVLNATGKAGRGVCRALVEAGFDVYGTTRWIGRPLPVAGATAVTCDRTTFGGMLHALETTGARKLFLSTDYFHAAARNAATEVSQGLCALQAAQVCGVEHVVFMGVADAERVSTAARQVHSKLALESHLRASGLGWSIVRPALFFENLADPAARNPLVKGEVRLPSLASLKYCAAYDMGRIVAQMLRFPQAWLNRYCDVVSWKGTLADVALSLSQVSGIPTRYALSMSRLVRRLLHPEVHHWLSHYERHGGPRTEPCDTRAVLPDAMSVTDWFRHHGHYSNGEVIAP